MIKLRFPRRILSTAPVVLVVLALALAAACTQDREDATREVPIPPATRTVESQRALTGEERAAVVDFSTQLQSIEGEWALFYEDFDTWMSDLTECLPSTAQERLREFGAAYTEVADAGRNLPRTATTNEPADLIAAAADQEESSFRHLRDRWQPGNVALFEAVEQARVGGASAQNDVRDLVAAKQDELEEGPSAAEVAEMEEFSDDFDEIADAWDDFHDDYAALAKRESRLESEVLLERYDELVDQFSAVVLSIEDLQPSDISDDLIDGLLDVAEAELDAVKFLAESVALELAEEEEEEESEMPETEVSTSSVPAPGIQQPQRSQVSFPAQQSGQESAEGATEAPPEPAEGEPKDDEPAMEEAPMPGPAMPQEPERPTVVVGVEDGEDEEDGPSPREQMLEALAMAETELLKVDLSIEEVVDDKSAEQLSDLGDFVVEFEDFVIEWNGFYEGFIDWRATNGGCDQVRVVAGLNEYSQRAAVLARTARGLPQTGLLLPVYVLVAEAAERDANAMRTLANTWTPFAVDSFRAVDEERVNSGRLRRQASIALEELQRR